MELQKAVFSRRTLTAVLLAVAVLMNPFYLDGGWGDLHGGDILDVITGPMALSGFTPFACVFPGISCGYRFVEEYNSNYIRFSLPRYGKKRYIASKIFSDLCTGGCIMAAAFSIVFAIVVAFGNPVTEVTNEFYLYTIWKPYMLIWGGKLVLLLKVGLAFLFGAVWSLMALLVAAIYPNRYAVIVIPFMIYQIFWHLLDNALNPVWLLRADRSYEVYSALYVPYLIQSAVILFLIILNIIFLRRRCYGR